MQAWVNRSRYEWDEYNYEEKEIRWGLPALPTGFAERKYPKDSSYPHDQQKYDGSQEPESWLSDYHQALKILGGSKATTI
jgi:hypothetical protein